MFRRADTVPKRNDAIRRPRTLRIATFILYIYIVVCLNGNEKLAIVQRKARTAVKSYISSYPALHRMWCDFNKETVKVFSVKWASF